MTMAQKRLLWSVLCAAAASAFAALSSSVAWAFQTTPPCPVSVVASRRRARARTRSVTRSAPAIIALGSSFYDDFEDFDTPGGSGGGDDNDDDKEGGEGKKKEDEMDDAALLAEFRSRMETLASESSSSGLGDDDAPPSSFSSVEAAEGTESISSIDDLISFATRKSKKDAPPTDWALPLELESGDDDMSEVLRKGAVLLANPSKFCADFAGEKRRSTPPSPALLAKFGLTLPPPAELGPDRRADLLPVLVLIDRHPLRGCQAVLMNRRTGYLLGDLEQQQAQLADDDEADDGGGSGPPQPPRLGAFMIQPLWFGGTSAGGSDNESSGVGSGGGGGGGAGGLDMLHLCPLVDGASKLTEDGLYWGGDPVQAQSVMDDDRLDKPMTGFDFKFFVQSTRWLPMQLEKEVRDGTWYVASVSKDVLFRSRDRLGTKRAKPLWTEVMELMGGEYKAVRDRLYDDDDS